MLKKHGHIADLLQNPNYLDQYVWTNSAYQNQTVPDKCSLMWVYTVYELCIFWYFYSKIASEFCSFHMFILKDTTEICGIIKFI